MPNDVDLTSPTVAVPHDVPGATTAILEEPTVIDPRRADVTTPPDDVAAGMQFAVDDVVAASPAKSRLGLLRERDFRQLFLADSGSQFGTQIGWLALPLVAAVTLHASAFQMGVITAAEGLPYLLATLPAGAIADRSRRRLVMIVCDLARMLTLVSVPLAWWLGALTIWQIVAVAFGLGLFSAVFDVAYQSFLPCIVSSEKLVEGNSKLQGVGAVSQIGGPAIAGFVIRALTAPVAVGVNAITYLSSALFLGRIRAAEQRPQQRQRAHLGRDIIEGLRFVQRNELLRAIAGTAALCNFFSAMTSSMIVFLLARILDLSAGTIGALLSISSIGGLIGALFAHAVAKRIGEGRVLWLSLAVGSPFLVVVPLMQNNFTLWLAAASFSVAVACGVVFNVTSVSFRQRLAPPHLLGRVNATMRFIVVGIMPLGGLVGGAFGTWFGVRETLWVAAIGSMLTFLPAFFSPLRSMRTLPTCESS